MIEFHAHETGNPGFDELLGDLINTTWKMEPMSGYTGAIQRVVNGVVLDQLMILAADQHASAQLSHRRASRSDLSVTYVDGALE